MRDIIPAIIGLLISPFVLLYELGRYIIKKITNILDEINNFVDSFMRISV